MKKIILIISVILRRFKNSLIVFPVMLIVFTSCSQNEDLVMECKGPDLSLYVKISNKKFCFIDPSGKGPTICEDVLTYDSKLIQTINFNAKSSEFGQRLDFGEDAYIKIDRTTGMLSAHFARNNKKTANVAMNCTKKEKL